MATKVPLVSRSLEQPLSANVIERPTTVVAHFKCSKTNQDMNWLHELGNTTRWKKYSQCYEESYIEKIFEKLNIDLKSAYIVEIGAWDGFHLSNTRYFIENGANALLIDGNNHGNSDVREHFITVENVNEILESYKVPTKFDLLCIDIDGNDIYVINQILKKFKPSIILAEFNPIFEKGVNRAIRYNKSHIWGENDFYGFSFTAGEIMAKDNGYSVIFQNDSLNMYFVENEILSKNLGVEKNKLHQYIPTINFEIKHDHPECENSDWVEYNP